MLQNLFNYTKLHSRQPKRGGCRNTGEHMNDEMKQAWLEITQHLGEPTKEEVNVFLRTWQRAIQAERDECAKRLDELGCDHCAAAIRARGQA